LFTIIIIFFPCWWLSYNKLFYLSCAQWSLQQATAAFAMHVGNALFALGAEAGDKEHLTVVVLAMKKDGLVLPGSRQEARLPGAQPSRRTSAVSLWPSRKRLGPDAHARQCGRHSSFLNWSGTLPALPLKRSSLMPS